MSEENTQTAPAAEVAPQASSELQPGAAPQSDGGETQANDTQQKPEQPAGETEEQRNAKRERFDRRFSDLSKRAREAELVAAEERGRRIALEDALRLGVKPQEQASPEPAKPAGPPNPDDYPQGKFDPDYLEAKVLHRLQTEAAERKAAEESEKSEAAKREAHEAGKKRFVSTIEQAETLGYGGGADVLTDLARGGDLTLVDAITECANPAHIAQILHNNPQHFDHLKSLTPSDRIRQLTLWDAKVSENLKKAQPAAQPAPEPKPVPAPQKQPEPFPTVTPSGGAPQFNPERANFKEFQAYAHRVWSAPNGKAS